MINFTYESTVQRDSQVLPGVTFLIELMSFTRRIELMKAIREATTKAEFTLAAETSSPMTEAILSAEVDRLYLLWGLKEVRGLFIDEVPATTESLLSSGPEDLVREALTFVKFETGLSEQEKKT